MALTGTSQSRPTPAALLVTQSHTAFRTHIYATQLKPTLGDVDDVSRADRTILCNGLFLARR